jgi:hypothetical protein
MRPCQNVAILAKLLGFILKSINFEGGDYLKRPPKRVITRLTVNETRRVTVR